MKGRVGLVRNCGLKPFPKRGGRGRKQPDSEPRSPHPAGGRVQLGGSFQLCTHSPAARAPAGRGREHEGAGSTEPD